MRLLLLSVFAIALAILAFFLIAVMGAPKITVERDGACEQVAKVFWRRTSRDRLTAAIKAGDRKTAQDALSQLRRDKNCPGSGGALTLANLFFEIGDEARAALPIVAFDAYGIGLGFAEAASPSQREPKKLLKRIAKYRLARIGVGVGLAATRKLPSNILHPELTGLFATTPDVLTDAGDADANYDAYYSHLGLYADLLVKGLISGGTSTGGRNDLLDAWRTLIRIAPIVASAENRRDGTTGNQSAESVKALEYLQRLHEKLPTRPSGGGPSGVDNLEYIVLAQELNAIARLDVRSSGPYKEVLRAEYEARLLRAETLILQDLDAGELPYRPNAQIGNASPFAYGRYTSPFVQRLLIALASRRKTDPLTTAKSYAAGVVARYFEKDGAAADVAHMAYALISLHAPTATPPKGDIVKSKAFRAATSTLAAQACGATPKCRRTASAYLTAAVRAAPDQARMAADAFAIKALLTGAPPPIDAVDDDPVADDASDKTKDTPKETKPSPTPQPLYSYKKDFRKADAHRRKGEHGAAFNAYGVGLVSAEKALAASTGAERATLLQLIAENRINQIQSGVTHSAGGRANTQAISAPMLEAFAALPLAIASAGSDKPRLFAAQSQALYDYSRHAAGLAYDRASFANRSVGRDLWKQLATTPAAAVKRVADGKANRTPSAESVYAYDQLQIMRDAAADRVTVANGAARYAHGDQYSTPLAVWLDYVMVDRQMAALTGLPLTHRRGYLDEIIAADDIVRENWIYADFPYTPLARTTATVTIADDGGRVPFNFGRYTSPILQQFLLQDDAAKAAAFADTAIIDYYDRDLSDPTADRDAHVEENAAAAAPLLVARAGLTHRRGATIRRFVDARATKATILDLQRASCGAGGSNAAPCIDETGLFLRRVAAIADADDSLIVDGYQVENPYYRENIVGNRSANQAVDRTLSSYQDAKKTAAIHHVATGPYRRTTASRIPPATMQPPTTPDAVDAPPAWDDPQPQLPNRGSVSYRQTKDGVVFVADSVQSKNSARPGAFDVDISGLIDPSEASDGATAPARPSVAIALTGAQEDVLIYVHDQRIAGDPAAVTVDAVQEAIDFPGAVMVFSWPAIDAAIDAAAAFDQARASQQSDAATSLRSFLGLARAASDGEVHILAHGAGNQVLFDALADAPLLDESPDAPAFGQIVMATPDVTRAAYMRFANAAPRLAKGATLYVSAADAALQDAVFDCHRRMADRAEEETLAANAAPQRSCLDRIGRIADDRAPVLSPFVETIDMTIVDKSGSSLAALPFGATKVYGDISRLLSTPTPPSPSQRGLEPVTTIEDATYWRFTP